MSFSSKQYSIPRRQVIENEVILSISSGFGSTNTKIRNYTKVYQVGNGLQANLSSVDGSSITILKDGVYSCCMQDQLGSGSGVVAIGISALPPTGSFIINTDAGLGNFFGFPYQVCSSNSGVAKLISISRATFLKAGTIVRFHTDGTGSDSGDGLQMGSVTQVG